MGLMKASKVTSIGSDAAAARDKGHKVFVCRYWDEVLNFQNDRLDRWSDGLEARDLLLLGGGASTSVTDTSGRKTMTLTPRFFSGAHDSSLDRLDRFPPVE